MKTARAVAFLLPLASAALDCDEAIVGGGWAGVYFAHRRASTVANASTVCLFERSSRIGGRTYSVPIEDTEFTLDVGAYRFSPDMHLPGDLILHHLQLPTECYEPSCPPAYADFAAPFPFNYTAPLRRVDGHGRLRRAQARSLADRPRVLLRDQRQAERVGQQVAEHLLLVEDLALHVHRALWAALAAALPRARLHEHLDGRGGVDEEPVVGGGRPACMLRPRRAAARVATREHRP